MTEVEEEYEVESIRAHQWVYILHLLLYVHINLCIVHVHCHDCMYVYETVTQITPDY